MLIGGMQKLSLIDFPTKIAATVFTQGCPFRCHYCHNTELVLPEKFNPPILESDIFQFLNSRIGKLDAVVISGGEPTMQPDLPLFIKKIKDLGFLVKLDTSGINP
jgi:pyruvate formate lyase activating enzyme